MAIPSSTSTLAKLIELLQTQEDYEAIIKTARFLQKALEMLGHDIPENKLIDLSKKFCDRGIFVEGDLSVLSSYAVEEKLPLNISKMNNLMSV